MCWGAVGSRPLGDLWPLVHYHHPLIAWEGCVMCNATGWQILKGRLNQGWTENSVSHCNSLSISHVTLLTHAVMGQCQHAHREVTNTPWKCESWGCSNVSNLVILQYCMTLLLCFAKGMHACEGTAYGLAKTLRCDLSWMTLPLGKHISRVSSWLAFQCNVPLVTAFVKHAVIALNRIINQKVILLVYCCWYCQCIIVFMTR